MKSCGLCTWVNPIKRAKFHRTYIAWKVTTKPWKHLWNIHLLEQSWDFRKPLAYNTRIDGRGDKREPIAKLSEDSSVWKSKRKKTFSAREIINKQHCELEEIIYSVKSVALKLPLEFVKENLLYKVGSDVSNQLYQNNNKNTKKKVISVLLKCYKLATSHGKSVRNHESKIGNILTATNISPLYSTCIDPRSLDNAI